MFEINKEKIFAISDNVYASSEVFIPTLQDKLCNSDNALFNYLRLNLHQTKG